MHSNRTQTYEEIDLHKCWPHDLLIDKGPIRNRQGEVIGLFGIARDISERKQAAKQLYESELRMRLAIRGGDLGLWDWACG